MCPRDYIYNYKSHFFRWAGELGRDIKKQIYAETAEIMQENAYEYEVTLTKAFLQKTLKTKKEDTITIQVIFDELAREVAGIEEHKEVKEKGQIVAAMKTVYTVEQWLQSLSIAQATLDHHALLSVNCWLAFYNCQRKLQLEKNVAWSWPLSCTASYACSCYAHKKNLLLNMHAKSGGTL